MYRRCMTLFMRVSAVMLAVLFLTSCGAGSNTETAEDPDRPMEIGFTFDSLVIERWERDRDVFVSTARELGIDVNVQNANGDVDQQISQIEYFIDKHVQAIVIVAVDCNALAPVIAKAHRAGVRVISYDRLISNANTDLFISFDNYKVGELMAQSMEPSLHEGDSILMVNGPLTDTNVPTVMEGFRAHIDRTPVKIAQIGYCAGWRPEYAFDQVSGYLSEHPEEPPVAIMCGNDSLAGQAVKALSERKLAGDVIVTGQDADLDACQRIVEGTQYMTVYKPVEKLAQRAAELAADLVRQGRLDTSETINDGTYEVPCEKLEPVCVTAENMDEIIIGTFHQRSEVYLNVDDKRPESDTQAVTE